MANKGGSSYMKRLNAPKYFAIHRKEHKYVTKPNPGRHSLKKSVALGLLMAKLGVGTIRKEYEKALRDGLVKVNGMTIKEPKYPVGLNDVVSIGDESYAIKVNEQGQLAANKDRGGKQFYKVVGKYKDKNNEMMLRLHDGTIVKGGNDANVNDSVMLSGTSISKMIKLDSGSKCEVIDGVHVGKSGKISEIRPGSMHKQKSVIVEPESGAKFETLVKNIIVVE